MHDHSPTLLSLARELRDQIYDTLLFTAVAKPLSSIPPHLLDFDNQVWWSSHPWKWYLDPGPGSCYGLMYSCKQIHSEFIQSIERHGGLTFEFELALVGIPYPLLFEEYYPIDREEVWLTPAVLPLCLPSQNDNLSFPQAATTCKRLHVSIKAQSELNFRWHGNGGLSWTTRSLFTMLARFLLYGPLGLFKNLGTGAEWNINNLFIDITGIGATFEDPHNGRLRTVPSGVIENVEVNLSEWLDILCRSGALSGRIHTVHLALDGEIKRYWSIEEGKSLPSAVKKDWGDYGWIITRQDIRRRPKTVPKHRKWSPTSRCTLQ